MIKFFIDQHGCAKNRVDGEILSTYLGKNNYELTMNPDEADIILINSCGFIESAKQESLDAVIQTRNAYPGKKIILTGCLAERYADLFKDSLPEADAIMGNGDLSKIVEVADDVMKNQRPVVKTPQKGVSGCIRENFFGFKNSAFVKITEGCSNHCTFCAIPLIRGELRSRKASEIIEEIKGLIASGIYEINLIGQDLAAYGSGVDDGEIRKELSALSGYEMPEKAEDFFPQNAKTPLAGLLHMISQLEGRFIVRLLYIHPDHLNFDVLDEMKKDDRFLHYFDIPFQSGSDSIIKSMNRRGTASSYLKMISDMKKIFPDLVLRTTFMTGFPGESGKNFDETYDFLTELKPTWSGCFNYSLEEDTPAYEFRHRVGTRKAKKRAETLEIAQSQITEEWLKGHVGQVYDVLIEEVLPDADDNLAIGRAWFQAPEVDGAVVVRFEPEETDKVYEGAVVKAKILAVSGVDLDSRLVS